MKSISVFLALVLISLALVGCGCGQTNGSSGPEQIGAIQIPDGPKIKVYFNGPEELKAEWEKIGMNGFQIQILGTLTNISSQTISFTEIAFLQDGTQTDYIPGRTLAPGAQMPIAKGFPNSSENQKTLEIKIKGFQIKGQTPATNQTVSQTTAQAATIPSTTTGSNVYTKAPANPKTPGEIIAAFYFFCSEGSYAKAENLCSDNFLEEYSSIETLWRRLFGRKTVTKVAIDREEINEDSSVDITIYFETGDSDSFHSIVLVKEKELWKIYQ